MPNILLISRCFIEKAGQVLLLHRSSKRKYNPNLWELPGGKVEAGQDINNATEREILEETGLLIKIISPVAFSESKVVDHGKYKGMIYLELVNRAIIVAGKISLGDDHVGFAWAKKKDIFNYDLSQESRKSLTFFLS
ncbi:MAG: NUDIX domain-containing protein [Candidatus Shapirobacteria bacterium]|jgi:8-oxo-dGTP diphosphatase